MREQAGISEKDKAALQSPLAIRLLPLILLAAAAAVIWWSGGLDYISLQQLAEHRATLRSWVSENLLAALLAYVGLYAGVVALSLPVAAPLTLAGGLLFGWLLGGFATVAAATLGAVAIFILARTALAGPLGRRAGARLDRLRSGFQENALSYLLFLRLVPAFPFWLVNLAPALLGVPLRTFVIATFIGIIPGTFAFALTGAGLDSVLVAHQQAYEACVAKTPAPGACSFDLDPASLLTPELLLAFAALGVVALIPAMVKRFWKDKPGAA
jgi:uncharacterized membrane protein YdjX (TVP38/TMEM64 family)